MKLGIADSKEILTVVQDGKKKEYELKLRLLEIRSYCGMIFARALIYFIMV